MNKKHYQKQRKVRISTLLTPEEAELFEAWRQQHYSGRGFVSGALRSLIRIYLGVKGTPPNAPGFNSAWEKTPGWALLDPRSPGEQMAKYKGACLDTNYFPITDSESPHKPLRLV